MILLRPLDRALSHAERLGGLLDGSKSGLGQTSRIDTGGFRVLRARPATLPLRRLCLIERQRIHGRDRMEGEGELLKVNSSIGARDPVALILSANVTRRHLSKGQQAMAVAKALLLSNTSKSDLSRQTGINRTRIAQAGIVLEYAPDLADSVLLGATPLNEAYEEARHRKQEAQERARSSWRRTSGGRI